MLRGISLGAAILAGALAASAAHAESRPNAAPPGWSSRQAPTGTVFFTCGRPSCGGASSLLSIAPKAAIADMTVEKFQAAQAATNQRILQQVPGISTSRLGPAMMADMDGVRVFTAQRDQVTTSGKTQVNLIALLTGPQASISVVSEAADSKTAAANFRQFLPTLVTLAKIAPAPR